MDWSMPPEAVPVYLYPVITFSMKFYLLPSWYGPWSPLLAWIEASAEHTHRAEELDRPEATGTFPDIMISIPLSVYLDSSLTPAR